MTEKNWPEPVGVLRSHEYDGHEFELNSESWPFDEPLYTATQVREIVKQDVSKAVRLLKLAEELHDLTKELVDFVKPKENNHAD